MNRIFDPAEPIDLAVEPASDQPTPSSPAASPLARADGRSEAAPAGGEPGVAARSGVRGLAAVTGAHTPASRPHRPSSRPLPPTPAASGLAGRLRRPDDRLLLIGTLCGVCLASVVGSLLYFGHWTRLQQSIAQERNLLLLERLRSLGPANPTPVQGPEPAPPVLPAPATSSASGVEGLPPPPPQEAWIEQLSSLPQSAPTPSRVLTVPVSPRLAGSSARVPSQASSASAAAPATGPLPQLVGVVAGAGRAPSAIFLVGGNSMSVASGEQIGTSGWRLRSAEGETALIERGAELRQVSIASGNGF